MVSSMRKSCLPTEENNPQIFFILIQVLSISKPSQKPIVLNMVSAEYLLVSCILIYHLCFPPTRKYYSLFSQGFDSTCVNYNDRSWQCSLPGQPDALIRNFILMHLEFSEEWDSLVLKDAQLTILSSCSKRLPNLEIYWLHLKQTMTPWLWRSSRTVIGQFLQED